MLQLDDLAFFCLRLGLHRLALILNLTLRLFQTHHLGLFFSYDLMFLRDALL